MMAFGAVDALAAAGRRAEVVGVNGLPEAIANIQRGHDAGHAPISAPSTSPPSPPAPCCAISRGEPVPKEIMVPRRADRPAQHRPMDGADGRPSLSRLGRDRAIVGHALRRLHRFCAGALGSLSPRRRRRPAPAPAPASNQLELNSASRDDLMTLDGIGEVRADAIIRARPFKAKTELVERRLIPEALYEKIADKVFARPPPARADARRPVRRPGQPSAS